MAQVIVPASQAQSPEFKPWYNQKKGERERERERERIQFLSSLLLCSAWEETPGPFTC
jgi:hypothetical protein